MNKPALFAAALVCTLSLSSLAHSQTAINRFDEVAGKWTGFAEPHNYKVTLEIDPSGRFRAASLLGSESGQASLERGTIVIPLVEHMGTLQLLLQGGTLR